MKNVTPSPLKKIPSVQIPGADASILMWWSAPSDTNM